jgi:hypothetical protein
MMPPVISGLDPSEALQPSKESLDVSSNISVRFINKKIFGLSLRVGWPWKRLFNELPLLISQLLKLNGALITGTQS